MLSCSIWFSAPSFWMGGGLESRCVGRVCGADGAVRVTQVKNKFLVVNAAVNLRVPLNAGHFLISRGTVSFVSRCLAPWIQLGYLAS